MRILVISEKDDAAKRIAQMLSDGKARAKKTGKAPVHSFKLDGQSYHVVGTKGHLVELDYPTEFRNWRGTAFKDLIWADPYKKVAKGKRDIQTALKTLGKDCDRVIVATDYDREGELIGVEALEILEKAKVKVPIQRARFSSLTKKAIQNAFDALVEVDYNLAAAAESRQIVDLAWGAALTRFISLAGKARRGEYLSVGRVQSPTLAVLVDKEREIRNFVPEPYWDLSAHIGGDVPFEAQAQSGSFKDEAEAQKAYEQAKDAGEARVESFTEKDVTEPAPPPFNTTDFQRQASSNLGMTAKRAMDLAEGLYMSGFISYPRTDNTYYPEEEDLEEILAGIATLPAYKGLVQQLASVRRKEPTHGKKKATDHPPIHPMEPPKPGELREDEQKVYDLVVRRFLATLAEDAHGQDRSTKLDIGGQPFKASGYRLESPGWRHFYEWTGRKKPDLPDLEEGQVLPVTKVVLEEKETQPPRRYGQAGLIAKMEELGLGTKSTRHEIIERLSNRQYVKSPQTLQPTETAFAVMDALERYAEIITKPEMTAALESDMEEVAEGKKPMADVVKESRELLEKAIAVLEEKKEKLGPEIQAALREQNKIGPCPTCGKDLVQRIARKTRKRFIGCTGWPDCNQTFPLPQNGFVESLRRACEGCGSPMMRLLSRGRRPWEFCANMDCPLKEQRDGPKAAAEEPVGQAEAAASEEAG